MALRSLRALADLRQRLEGWGFRADGGDGEQAGEREQKKEAGMAHRSLLGRSAPGHPERTLLPFKVL